jgi:hypothetical protein
VGNNLDGEYDEMNKFDESIQSF